MKRSSLRGYNNNYGVMNGAEEYMNGFPWPPRSYSCSFCKKEFKSAQALGGHMNVHRRDRARLRQSSPTHDHDDDLNLNLNPNFSTSSNFSLLPSSSSSFSSSCATPLKPVTTTLLPLFVSSSSSPPAPSSSSWVVVDSNGILLSKKAKNIAESFSGGNVGKHDDAAAGCKMLKKKAEILMMDLKIGLPTSYNELDLELRLGTNYS